MSYWIPSSKCRIAARKCAREIATELFPRTLEGERPNLIITSNARVVATDIETVICPNCADVHSPEYCDNGNPPIPTHLYVTVAIKVPISSLPDSARDGASSEVKLEKLKGGSSTSQPPKLDMDELSEFLRVE